jgi:hypothetical protein
LRVALLLALGTAPAATAGPDGKPAPGSSESQLEDAMVEIMTRYGIRADPAKSKIGQCYRLAAELAIAMGHEGYTGVKVVAPAGHAFITYGSFIIDPDADAFATFRSTGRPVLVKTTRSIGEAFTSRTAATALYGVSATGTIAPADAFSSGLVESFLAKARQTIPRPIPKSCAPLWQRLRSARSP